MTDPRQSPPQHIFQHRGFVAQWVIWLLMNAIFIGSIAFEQRREYQNTLRAEKAHMLTQVRIAEQVLTTQIRSADAALRTMLAGLDRWRGPDGYLPFAREHLKRVEQMMPGSRTFYVLDSQGVCQLSNQTNLIGAPMEDRAFFGDVNKGVGPDLLHVAAPHLSAQGDLEVTISRVIHGPDGRFQGVVASTLSPGFFEELMKELRYAPDMRIAVMHAQGGVYVTSPPSRATDAENRNNQLAWLEKHLRGGTVESYQDGHIGDSDRMSMVRTIDLASVNASRGFVAMASRSEATIFEVWRRDVALHMVFWFVFFLVVSVALWRYQRGSLILLAKSHDAETAMQRSIQRFEQVAGTIPCVLFDYEVDKTGNARVLYVGPYSQTLLGLAPEYFMENPNGFVNYLHPDDRSGFQSKVDQSVRDNASLDCEFRFISPQGQERWLQMTATPGTGSGPGSHWSGFIFDITEDKKRQLALHSMAYQDVLTNAENRRSFMEKLQAELARVQRTGEAGAVVMLDIDHFKNVNDTYGHDAGDAVLKHLVHTLQGVLRRIDTLGRLGGEEFAILLPATPWESALVLAERLRQTVQESPAVLQSVSINYTVSIGVAILDGKNATIDPVLKAADKAMYAAKHTGRNRVCHEER